MTLTKRGITPVTTAICLALDLASKSWVKAHLTPGVAVPAIPGILRLTLTTNAGAAFGLGKQSATLMTVLAVTIAAAVIYWICKREADRNLSICERLGMGFLLGGALGNIYDRLAVGKVTDFLEFAFIDFPVFNLADVCIDIGAVLIVLRVFAQGESQKNSSADKGTPDSSCPCEPGATNHTPSL